MRVGQARKRDASERAIVAALEAIGVVVHRLSSPGLPDLLTWHPREGLRLLEVKRKGGTFTPAQQQLRMPFVRIETTAEALALFGVTDV